MSETMKRAKLRRNWADLKAGTVIVTAEEIAEKGEHWVDPQRFEKLRKDHALVRLEEVEPEPEAEAPSRTSDAIAEDEKAQAERVAARAKAKRQREREAAKTTTTTKKKAGR